MQTQFEFPATAMPNRDWWTALWPNPEDVLRTLGIEPGMTVVDLCCGDGYFTAPLAVIVDGSVWAIDLDPHMLALARDEARRLGAPPCRWILGDARDLDQLIPDRVDYVLLANTFHGVPEKSELVSQVAAVLRSGGHFAIVNWHALLREETVVLDRPRGPRTELRMRPEQVRTIVEPGGFRLERVVELPPYHYGAVFRKTEQAGEKT